MALTLAGPFGGPPPTVDTYLDRRIEWREWEARQPLCPKAQIQCEQCDSYRAVLATGIMHPMDGDTFPSLVTVRAKRSGREYDRTVERTAHAVTRLHARRCLDCGITNVWDMGDDGRQWVELSLSQLNLF